MGERARLHAALGVPARLAIVDALSLGDASPGELATRLELPTNLLAHHLKVLSEVGLVSRVPSEGDRRRTYLRLVKPDPDDLTAPIAHPPGRVVFVCTQNSARSQLAAVLWPRRSSIPAASAGTRPTGRVHPRAVRTARRHGLSLRGARTAHITDVLGPGDLVITVCDNAHEDLEDTQHVRLHWSVPDPARPDTDDAFETAYTELAARIERLAPTLSIGADHD